MQQEYRFAIILSPILPRFGHMNSPLYLKMHFAGAEIAGV